jgi:hypothetical protein
MPYTIWYRGELIGETDFEGQRSEIAPAHSEMDPAAREGRHLAGVFRPTTYGRQLLPRLCGIMSAAADLKEEVARRGLDPEDVPPDIMRRLFEGTPAGLHILDIGRVLSEVELRSPTGLTVVVASMGFMDIGELASLSRRLGCSRPTVNLDDLPPEAPEFLVSVTLQELTDSVYS